MIRMTRMCGRCGEKRQVTTTQDALCRACWFAAGAQKRTEAEKSFLEDLYTKVSLSHTDQHGKRHWTFTHECGVTQTWAIGNVRTQARKGFVPCRQCGPDRAKKALLAGYIAKYGIDYDVTKFSDYAAKVRLLSNRNYNAHKAVINPRNYSRTDYHLDHKAPVIQCFKEGIPIHVAADPINLQMLPALENLSKNDRPDVAQLQLLRELT